MSADQGLREKMREWVENTILNCPSYSNQHLNHVGENIKAAIASGIDMQVMTDGMGRTLLHEADLFSEEVVQALIDARADVNARDNYWGATPLLGSYYHMEILLNAGADPLLGNYHGSTPIHYAAANLHFDNVTLLIDAGVDVNARANYDGRSPLHSAVDDLNLYFYVDSKNAKKRKKKTIRTLIQAGADVNARDNYGKTPIKLTRDEVIKKALRAQRPTGWVWFRRKA